MNTWMFFLLLTIVALAVQGFFSMLEMALVSFNKVRLQYYLQRSNRRAVWINKLLNHPAKLFGTTLIGVNFALQFGSEFSRRFYEALGLSPDLAPISQVFVVLIFSELSPMFAARRYAEHVCLLGIPIIYFSSIAMTPVIWFLDKLCVLIHKIFRLAPVSGNYLTREELQKAIEERGEQKGHEAGEFDHIALNIFSLKNKIASDLMLPLTSASSIPTTFTTTDLKNLSAEKMSPYYLVYEHEEKNIIGILYPRDVIGQGLTDSIRVRSRTPWFITEQSSVMEIIKQFRWNNQTLAVVLNESGIAQGILTLDAIIREIFRGEIPEKAEDKPIKPKIIIDRTFPGDKMILEIQEELQISIKANPEKSLEEVMAETLHHHPAKGDFVHLDGLTLTVVDAPLIGELQINIKTT